MEEFLSDTDSSNREVENKQYLATLTSRVERINALETDIEDLSDDELVSKTDEFRLRLKNGEDINGKILEEAFAVVREAAWRVLEQRHYDVQLVGGMILHGGRLAEMATGEGKTLVSTLPCYLNALTGKTAFVVTVNDYLAKRDMEKMGQVHRFLGLSVGLIQSSMNEEERREAYARDVVYVTNSELGFDYLRDHLAFSPNGIVLPQNNDKDSTGFNSFCVVDEADSVLIDEARTPLIISKQVPAPASKYKVANTLAAALKNKRHYDIDLKNKNVVLNERGFRDSENALGVQSLFELPADGTTAWAPYVINAVKAKELFTKDIEYSVVVDEDGKKTGVGIIDSFTGRVLDGRKWSNGLHQSIEAMESIDVSSQSQVIAKITYQSLFRQFSLGGTLSGMTGTAMSDADELETTYDLRVTPVPTALPISRRDYDDVAFRTRKAANNAIVKEIIAVGGGTDVGRPCLIGTTSVSQSESIVAALGDAGLKAELLNANPLNAARESEIIAQAGRAGVVTVATNMAGRGTDILLGGCSSTMGRIKSRSVIVAQGVISKEEASKLPPVPKEDYFPVQLSDDVTFMLKDAASSIKKKFGADLTAIGLDEILTVATDTTESEEDPEYIVKLRDAVESVKEMYKDVLDAEKEEVRKLGGLYVMGTTRHESSRIDNQLRGRAGRQGDPGTSRFFVSFEDDMFVVFGGDGLQNILKTFRVSDDMPIEAPQVTDALEKVQRIVEEEYCNIRGEILNFDDILNNQRRIIYNRRQQILKSTDEEVIVRMHEYSEKTIKDIVEAQISDGDSSIDISKVLEKIGLFFPPLITKMTQNDLKGLSTDAITSFISTAAKEYLNAKVLEKKNLAKSANYLTLVTADNAWSDHLQKMEDLKETVILKKYQGLDIVAEYKEEAFQYFQGLQDKMRLDAVYSAWQSL